MGPRLRKAVASFGILVFLVFYIWAVLEIGQFIPEVWWAQVSYFAVAGLVWGVPVLPLISWANRTPNRAQASKTD